MLRVENTVNVKITNIGGSFQMFLEGFVWFLFCLFLLFSHILKKNTDK